MTNGCLFEYHPEILEDFSGDPILASQLAVWTAQTTHPEPTTGVMVKNLVAMCLGG